MYCYSLFVTFPKVFFLKKFIVVRKIAWAVIDNTYAIASPIISKISPKITMPEIRMLIEIKYPIKT